MGSDTCLIRRCNLHAVFCMDYIFLNKTGSSNIRTKNTQLTIVNNPQRDVKLERNTPLCVCVCVFSVMSNSS